MRILLCLLFLFFYSQFFGQERSEVIQQRIEFISEQLQSEDLDLTNFIEQLNYYYDNPININATTGEDLDELNLLSSVQINDLLLHRKAFGKFMTIYELQSLKYWDLICPMPTSPTEVIYRKGWYGITDNGVAFIQKEIGLPKYAFVWNDFAYEHQTNPYLMITDLIAEDELDELLKP